LHDRNIIKHKVFQVGDLVLLYDSKFLKHPGKLQMHWLGPFMIQNLIEVGVVHLKNLRGEIYGGLINGGRLKGYKDNSLPFVPT